MFVYLVIERKACSTYLQIHLNRDRSSTGGIRTIVNSIPLLRRFNLFFIPKQRMKKNFAMSILGPSCHARHEGFSISMLAIGVPLVALGEDRPAQDIYIFV